MFFLTLIFTGKYLLVFRKFKVNMLIVIKSWNDIMFTSKKTLSFIGSNKDYLFCPGNKQIMLISTKNSKYLNKMCTDLTTLQVVTYWLNLLRKKKKLELIAISVHTTGTLWKILTLSHRA